MTLPRPIRLFICLVISTLAGHAIAQVAVPTSPVSPAPAEVPLDPPPPPPAYTNLPDMGSGANALISRADEYQVGRMMVHNLRKEGAVLEDPEITEYINNIGQRIGSEAQEGTQRFQFFMVKDPSFNAFALPGGFIAVHSGLYMQTDSESELAGVIAHEIAHVTQRHIARAIQAQSRNSLPMMAALLGAILIGAMSGGDAAPGLIAMAQGAAMQQQINFTRMEEYEADRVGMGYLSSAGFDPNAVASLWSSKLRTDGVDFSEMPELLRTHPVDRLRIAEARQRAAQLPKRRVTDAPSYGLMRERIRVIASNTDTDLRSYYRGRLERGDKSVPVRYGLALAEMRIGSPATAARSLQQLVEEQPGNIALHNALGQAQMAAGQKDAALKSFAHAIGLFPRNVPLTVRYAEALIEAGQPGKAHALLLDVFNNVVPTPEQIRLTALAASAAGDTGDAYYYMSEYHISSGDLMLATQQLDLALTAPRLTDVQRKRFMARRDEIRGYLREQRRGRG
ncbi:MAG: M48 family metalloprotease [Steroidobacteraceae bacterium]